MVNKNYFTSQDASYSRTNVFTKNNIMIDFMRLPYTELFFKGLFFKTGEITIELIKKIITSFSTNPLIFRQAFESHCFHGHA